MLTEPVRPFSLSWLGKITWIPPVSAFMLEKLKLASVLLLSQR
jgi:hypothetical protein